MPSETISVVIPAYNSSATIVESLDSIAGQTFPVHEIIIVDDLSADNTIDVVKSWRNDHGEVKLVLIEQLQNSGPAGARNRGINAATGDWIAFLDSDDAWLSSKLSTQLNALSSASDVVLVCGCTIPLGEDRGEESGGVERELVLADFVAHNPIATSTVIAKREVLVALGGFDEQFCGPEDYDLWLRLVSEYKCLRLAIPLSRYRNTVGSLSMDERKFLPQVLRVLAKAFREGGALYSHQEYRRRAYAEQYSSASWMAYNRGARLLAVRLLLISWLYDVRHLHKEHDDPRLRFKLFVRYLFR